MQNIMKLDGRRESAVQKVGDSLLDYLDQSAPPGVSANPRGNQDNCPSCVLLGRHTFT